MPGSRTAEVFEPRRPCSARTTNRSEPGPGLDVTPRRPTGSSRRSSSPGASSCWGCSGIPRRAGTVDRSMRWSRRPGSTPSTVRAPKRMTRRPARPSPACRQGARNRAGAGAGAGAGARTGAHVRRGATPVAGKVAVVTGASRGLGAGLAAHFATSGMHLGLCALHRPRLVARTRPTAHDGRVESAEAPVCAAVDVADGDAVAAFADAVIARFGRIDLWVNNAGVLGPIGPLADTDPAETPGSSRSTSSA